MRDLRPASLLRIGLPVSLVFNVAVLVVICVRNDEVRDQFWEATLPMFLFFCFFGSIAVFGVMATITLDIQRIKIRKFATQQLTNYWIVSVVMIFFMGCCNPGELMTSFAKTWVVVAKGIAFAAFHVGLAIFLNLILRMLGIQRDRTDSNESESDENDRRM